jgi:hypothetical protein
MAFTLRLEALFDRAQHLPITCDLYTLERAAKQQMPGRRITLRQRIEDGHKVRSVEVVDAADTVLATWSGGAFLGYSRMIDFIAYARTTYASVKEDVLWQKLYNLQVRQIAYIENDQDVTKFEPTMPCMQCGIVLPERLLTIDHQRPQAGGHLEAVVKNFRACGLTQEGPRGAKGQMILQHLRGQLHFDLITPVPTRPNRPVLGGASVDARYTLSDEGAVLYSIVVAADCEEELKMRCMNSPINLTPLCQPCNSARGNPLKFG